MSDLIRRQDAIDALQKEINKGIPPFDDTMGSIRRGVRQASNIIEDLPSAQPEPIKINIDHELTKDEYEKLRKDLTDAPVVLLPSAQPERKTGFWYALEKGDKGYSAGDFKCSVCGEPNHTWIPKPNYCPNCGARMEE